MNFPVHLPELLDDIPRDIVTLFERYSLDVIRAGHQRYSADSILHRIRWHAQVEQGHREFKINDHWSAPLARWFIKRHPEHSDFFKLRKSKHDSKVGCQVQRSDLQGQERPDSS